MLYTIREGISNEKKLLLNYVKSCFCFFFKSSAVGDLYIHLRVFISFLCLRMNNEFEIYKVELWSSHIVFTLHCFYVKFMDK